VKKLSRVKNARANPANMPPDILPRMSIVCDVVIIASDSQWKVVMLLLYWGRVMEMEAKDPSFLTCQVGDC